MNRRGFLQSLGLLALVPMVPTVLHNTRTDGLFTANKRLLMPREYTLVHSYSMGYEIRKEIAEADFYGHGITEMLDEVQRG